MTFGKRTSWLVEFDPQARKDLLKLGSADRARVLRYLDERLNGSPDPKAFGKALTANLSGLWRYRVGDIRILARLEHDRLIILVIAVGNRRDVYQ